MEQQKLVESNGRRGEATKPKEGNGGVEAEVRRRGAGQKGAYADNGK